MMRRTCAHLLVLVLIAAPLQAAAQGTTAKTVGRDAVGDWHGSDPTGQGGEVMGQDLTRASISLGDDDMIDFALDVVDLPPGPPYTAASAVYEWFFSVDAQPFSLYGPCQGHIYGECETATDPLSFVVGWDEDEYMGIARVEDFGDGGRIVFPIPRSFLDARSGSVIRPVAASNNLTEDSVVAHTFYFVNSPTGSQISPRDMLTVTRNYRVP